MPWFQDIDRSIHVPAHASSVLPAKEVELLLIAFD
jgi:hypothetical protein